MKNQRSRHTAFVSARVSAFFLSLAVVLMLALGVPAAKAQGDDSSMHAFIEEAGEFLYFLAWPTAEFERVSLGGIARTSSGADLRVKLYGKSAFSGDALWTELVVEIRNGQITDIRWGRNNAMLAQPGSTVTAFSDVLAELSAQYQQSQVGTPAPQSNSALGGSASKPGYHFTNRCSRPLQLAIVYRKPEGGWETTGWWHFKPGEAAYLSKKDQRISAVNTIWYYYAETTDGSKLRWAGSERQVLDGRELLFHKLEDRDGDNDWFTTCD